MARKRLFSKDDQETQITPDADCRKRTMLAAKALSSTHKKLAEEYLRVTTPYTDIFSKMSSQQITDAQVLALSRLYTGLVEKTLEMQGSLNEALAILGAKPVSAYARPAGFSQIQQDMRTGEDTQNEALAILDAKPVSAYARPAGFSQIQQDMWTGEDTQNEKEKVRMSNLQYAILSGRIKGEARLLVDNMGVIFFSFLFNATEFGDKGNCTTYNVFVPSEGLIQQQIADGTRLVVCGHVRPKQDNEPSVIKANILILPNKTMRIIILVGKIADADATAVKRANGEDRMSFTLAVEDIQKEKRVLTKYVVNAPKTNALPYLTRGRSVVVTGTLRTDSAEARDFVHADNIELI